MPRDHRVMSEVDRLTPAVRRREAARAARIEAAKGQPRAGFVFCPECFSEVRVRVSDQGLFAHRDPDAPKQRSGWNQCRGAAPRMHVKDPLRPDATRPKRPGFGD